MQDHLLAVFKRVLWCFCKCVFSVCWSVWQNWGKESEWDWVALSRRADQPRFWTCSLFLVQKQFELVAHKSWNGLRFWVSGFWQFGFINKSPAFYRVFKSLTIVFQSVYQPGDFMLKIILANLSRGTRHLGVLISVWSESGFYLKRLVLLYEWRTITTSKLDRFPYFVFEHNTVVIYFYPRDLGSVQSGCVVFLFGSSIFNRLNN